MAARASIILLLCLSPVTAGPLTQAIHGSQAALPTAVNVMVSVYVNMQRSFKWIPALIVRAVTLNSLRGVSTGHMNKSSLWPN